MKGDRFKHVYDKAAMARSVARMLLEIDAVLFRANEPFKLTSGMVSPVYIDCRKVISFPRMRSAMMDYGATVILNDIGYESLDALAGGETAGIPFAAWLAERTHLPMQYVRKKPKGFGRDARIEGDISEGQRILLVEDLTTDGGSKLNFVEAMRTEFGLDFRLADFGQNTRSATSKAEAAAYVELVKDVYGKAVSVYGVGIDTSITMAPIRAVVSALNKL